MEESQFFCVYFLTSMHMAKVNTVSFLHNAGNRGTQNEGQ